MVLRWSKSISNNPSYTLFRLKICFSAKEIQSPSKVLAPPYCKKENRFISPTEEDSNIPKNGTVPTPVTSILAQSKVLAPLLQGQTGLSKKNLKKLDSPFFILSIIFQPLLWKKSPFDLHCRRATCSVLFP
jgi:hypothetical protein